MKQIYTRCWTDLFLRSLFILHISFDRNGNYLQGFLLRTHFCCVIYKTKTTNKIDIHENAHRKILINRFIKSIHNQTKLKVIGLKWFLIFNCDVDFCLQWKFQFQSDFNSKWTFIGKCSQKYMYVIRTNPSNAPHSFVNTQWALAIYFKGLSHFCSF